MTQDELQDIIENKEVIRLVVNYMNEVIERKVKSMGTAPESDLIYIRRSLDGMREMSRYVADLVSNKK